MLRGGKSSVTTQNGLVDEVDMVEWLKTSESSATRPKFGIYNLYAFRNGFIACLPAEDPTVASYTSAKHLLLDWVS